MQNEELNPSSGGSSPEYLPDSGDQKIPAKEHELVHQLKALPHKQRQKILSAFPSHGRAMQVGTAQTMHAQVMTASMTSVWSAPLPPPQELEAYNQIIPNGAERILAMAEQQSAHRIELENFAVRNQITQSGRGQIFGFSIGVLAMATGIGFALLGHPTAGVSVAVAALTILAVSLITGKSQEKTTRAEKRDAVEAMEQNKKSPGNR
jgi:uncharacterized membrane protein